MAHESSDEEKGMGCPVWINPTLILTVNLKHDKEIGYDEDGHVFPAIYMLSASLSLEFFEKRVDT